jgi:hypothetical protein
LSPLKGRKYGSTINATSVRNDRPRVHDNAALPISIARKKSTKVVSKVNGRVLSASDPRPTGIARVGSANIADELMLCISKPLIRSK